jgi:imidazolonepropionase-like amidohydrolase
VLAHGPRQQPAAENDVMRMEKAKQVTSTLKRFSGIVLSCSLLLCCATQSTSREMGEIVAFVGVNVVPMDSERVEMNQTVIVREGRIAKLGPSPRIEIPENAFVIDGAGKYLMPGLADMHVHLAGEFPEMLSLYLANGVTTVRNMWGSPDILKWRQRIEEGSLLGPRIYTTGPVIDGDPPCRVGMTVITRPEEVEAEVAAEKAAGYDAIKVYSNLSPEVYEAVLSSASRHQMPVYGHTPTRVGLANPLDRGQKSFEHMNDFLYALLPDHSPERAEVVEAFADCAHFSPRKTFGQPFMHANPDRIEPLAARVAKTGAWICPTVVVTQKMASSADEFTELEKKPSMRYVPPAVKYGWWAKMVGVLTSDQGDPAGMKEGVHIMLKAVNALHESGAHLLIGTDTFNPFVLPGFSTHEELENFVTAGLSPFDAIAAATRDAAEFIEAAPEFGTVQIGKGADLILGEGNPLQDVKNVSHLKGVMVRGRWFAEDDLRVMLDNIASGYRETDSEVAKPSGGQE